RQELLNGAIREGSTHRVLAIFREFMALHRVGGTPYSPPAQTYRHDQRTYSRQEIAKLYDQHRRGAYRGREAEWQALERDIIAGGAQGRIANPVDVQGK